MKTRKNYTHRNTAISSRAVFRGVITLGLYLLIVPTSLIAQGAPPEMINHTIILQAVVDTVRLYEDAINAIEAELERDPRKGLRVRQVIVDDITGEWKSAEIIELKSARLWTSQSQRRKEIEDFLGRVVDALNTVFGYDFAAILDHKTHHYLSFPKSSNYD